MVDTRRRAELLREVVSSSAPDELGAWFESMLPQPDAPLPRSRWLAAFAGCGRRFAQVTLSPGSADRLRAAGVEVPEAFDAATVARGALLLHALLALPAEEHVALCRDLLLRGDSGERIAVLRSLPLLPDPARFVELAIDACRSHVQDVFEAVARDNPYAAQHFPQDNFNQLVMKALFTEVPLPRVLGWRARNNPELVRMARDYRAERQAAGRGVPEDVARIEENRP